MIPSTICRDTESVSALVVGWRGLTDVDVLTVSMAKSAEGQVAIPVAAEAIAIGILSKTTMKLLLGAAIGRGRFRILTPAWLAIMAIASAVSIVVLR